jgi:hypothetical protein
LGLETIIEWNMTPEESETFHIALVYETEFKKMFFSDTKESLSYGLSLRRNCLPRRGDPRKSNLFRHCWKLRRETRGLLEKNEYKNYVKANLFIVKVNGGAVDPACITGDRAWIRYKVWKRRYDQKLSEINSQGGSVLKNTLNPKIFSEIDRTKKFLFEKCEGQPNFEKINKFIKDGIFKLWVATNKISYYYLTLSPFVEKSLQKDVLFSFCNASENLIRNSITPEILEYFKNEYRYEY